MQKFSDLTGDIDSLAEVKVVAFVHDHPYGRTVFHALVAADSDLPTNPIEANKAVEISRRDWYLYKKYIDLLGIYFNPADRREGLSCHSQSLKMTKVVDKADL